MDRSVKNRIGVYLAVVQLLFTTTWTVYVIFLPALAARVGIPAGDVTLILLLDQAIFVGTDLAMGVAADRVARVVGRLGYFILAVTLVSCAAFLLLPFVAEPDAGAPIFLVFAILWSATSSALRAPPLVLIGKYAAKPAQPLLASLSLFGLGIAGALAPYLTMALKDWDPRIPFVVSSLTLELATVGIVWAERRLAAGAAPSAETPPAPAGPALSRPAVFFFVAAALLGIGFQIHFVFNSAPLYLRFAKPPELAYLMPAFWIGFSLLMLPASWATRRVGGLVVMGAGAILGAVAARLGAVADSLGLEVVVQLLTGGAWGLVLMSATAAALAVGRTGREGKVTGALFAGLALAAFARIALVAAQLNKDERLQPAYGWTPSVVWALVGVVLVVFAIRLRKSV